MNLSKRFLLSILLSSPLCEASRPISRQSERLLISISRRQSTGKQGRTMETGEEEIVGIVFHKEWKLQSKKETRIRANIGKKFFLHFGEWLLGEESFSFWRDQWIGTEMFAVLSPGIRENLQIMYLQLRLGLNRTVFTTRMHIKCVLTICQFGLAFISWRIGDGET